MNTMAKSFDCHVCRGKYKSKKALQYHLQKPHLMEDKKKIICGECKRVVLSRKLLRLHCSEDHQMNFQEEAYCFKSFTEFRKWKLEVEKKNICRFVLSSGAHLLKNGTTRKYFVCHRDGYFESKSRKNKLMKSQGSNKINASCPAEIIYIQTTDGCINVQYWSNHLGHSENIGRLSLTSDERTAIAEKIQKGIPFQTILNEIRDSTTDVYLPINYVTKQDLRNIQRDFSEKVPIFNCDITPVTFTNEECKDVCTSLNTDLIQSVESERMNYLNPDADLITEEIITVIFTDEDIENASSTSMSSLESIRQKTVALMSYLNSDVEFTSEEIISFSKKLDKMLDAMASKHKMCLENSEELSD